MTDKTDDAPNEILSAVKEAKAHAAAAGGKARRKARTTNWPLAKIGLAAGIGSAAIAGAVLFAGRNKDDK